MGLSGCSRWFCYCDLSYSSLPKTIMKAVVKKFGIASASWYIIGCIILYFSGRSFTSDLVYFTLVFLWAHLNLVFLMMLMKTLFQFIKTEDANERNTLRFKILFWGTLKVSCLLFGVVFLWAGSDITGLALVLGVTSLLVVPLVGGLLWK